MRRHGRVEEELQAVPEAARRRGRFRRHVRQDPPGTTPQEWLEDPKVAEHPGLEPFQTECATCHIVEGLSEDEAGIRDAPKLFAWGSPQWIARMIHKPGAPDLYGYLEKKDQMPSFADQLTDERYGDAHPLPPQRLSRGHLPLGGPAQDRGGQGGSRLGLRPDPGRSPRRSRAESAPATILRDAGTGDDSGPGFRPRGRRVLKERAVKVSFGPGDRRRSTQQFPFRTRCATLASRSAGVEKKGRKRPISRGFSLSWPCATARLLVLPLTVATRAVEV